MITVNSVVHFKYEDDTDYGVLSKIENDDGLIRYRSAWGSYFECSFCYLENLTLIGPPILGVFNDEGS